MSPYASGSIMLLIGLCLCRCLSSLTLTLIKIIRCFQAIVVGIISEQISILTKTGFNEDTSKSAAPLLLCLCS